VVVRRYYLGEFPFRVLEIRENLTHTNYRVLSSKDIAQEHRKRIHTQKQTPRISRHLEL